jgi:hypothetical protein
LLKPSVTRLATPWSDRPRATTKPRIEAITVLSGVLWFLLSVLAVLLAIAAAALMTPVKLGFTVRTSPSWRLKIAARLLGGLTPPILIHDSAWRRSKEKTPTAKKKKKAAVSRQALARIRRAIAAAPRLLAGLLRPFRLERLTVDADIGLADPADTGQLFGLLAAVNYSRPPASAVSIAVRPDFNGPRASGELDAVLSFVPAAFIPPGVRLAWRVLGLPS